MEELECRLAPAAPVLTLQVAYGAGQAVTLSGTVQDEHPWMTSVSLSGAVMSQTVVTTNGTFSTQTQAMRLGTVTGVAHDDEGLSSAQVTVTLTSDAPAICDFQAVRTTGNLWTFSGRVEDESPGGLVVRFGGLATLENQSVVVNQDGTFSLTIELAEGEWGTASAQTQDWWSLDSETALAVVRPSS